MMLGRRVAHGAFWLVGARLATKLADFLSVLVLARFLLPDDFGLVALAVTALTIVNTLTELSIGNALVQLAEPTPEHYDTAFTIGFIRGFLVFAILLALALPMGWIYDDPRISPLVAALATSPLIKGLISPRIAKFLIDLQYVPQFFTELLGKIVGVGVSIAIVVATGSYWAIVWGIVVGPVITVAASYYFAPGMFRFRLTHWRMIFSFTSWLTLAQIVNTLNWQTDRLFVGAVLGKATLGQYVVGSEMASTSTYAIVGPLVQALFTGMMKVRDEAERLRRSYLLSQQILMALVMPIGVGLALLADPLVYLFLGPTWSDAVFVVQVTAPIFALQMLTAPAFSLVMTVGRTRMIFLRDLAGLLLRLPMVLAAAYIYGLHGILGAIVVAELIIIYLNLSIVRRLIGVGVVEQIKTPWRTIASVMVMAGIVGMTKVAQPTAVDLSPTLGYLAGAIAAGGGAYLVSHVLLWQLAGRPDGVERKLFMLARRA